MSGGRAALFLAAMLATASATAAQELRVVDAEGEPVAGAGVEILAPPETSSILSVLSTVVLRAETDERGGIAARVPALPGLMILVDHPGFAPLVASFSPATATVALDRGATLAGRLTTPEGESVVVERGRACARWSIRLEAWRSRRDRERCTRIDGAERFVLAGLPAGERVEVVVEAAGFLPADIRGAAGAAEPLAVALRPGILLAGELVDPRGQPIIGAQVDPEDRERSGEALPTSRFAVAVERLPAALEVRAPGYRPKTVRVTRPEEAQKLRIVLDPAEQLRGLLLSEDGGTVLEPTLALERFLPPSGWSLDELPLELDEGAFLVELPAPGRYRARLRAEGHRAFDVAAFDVAAGESRDVGAVILGRGAGVRGRLVDPATGDGVVGVDVRLVSLGTAAVLELRRGELLRSASDEEGRFVVAGLEAGRFELRARREGRAELVREVEVERDQVLELGEIALGRGARLTGRVSDRAGEAMPGVEVQLFSASGEALEPLGVWRTDRRGDFRGDRFAAGTYRVEVHRTRPLLWQQVEVGEDEDDVELDLVVSSVEVHGRVLRDGEPVAGGIVVLSSDLDPAWQQGKVLIAAQGQLDAGTLVVGAPSSMLDATVEVDGSFLVEDAPAGPVAATYYPPAGEPVSRRIVIEDRPQVWVEIDIAGGSLAGRTVDAQSEAGVAASIRLIDLAGRVARQIDTAPDGGFQIEDLDRGPFLLEASAEGYSTTTRNAVEPGPEPLVVSLEPGESGALDVRIVRRDGSPAAGAQVNVLTASGRMVRSLLADPSGTRLYEDLPPGGYFVVWQDSVGGVGASAEIALERGETRRVDLELAPAAPLTLSCTADRCGGGLLEQVALYTSHGVEIGAFLRQSSAPTRLDAGGAVVLGRVAPGSYLLRAWHAGKLHEQSVEVDANGGFVPL